MSFDNLVQTVVLGLGLGNDLKFSEAKTYGCIPCYPFSFFNIVIHLIIVLPKVMVMKWSIEWWGLLFKMSNIWLHLHKNRGGVIFSLQFVCLCVCVCLSVCLSVLWTKFQSNGCTDLEAVFAKWLLPALARTLLNLVTLGQRSRSQWRNTHFFFTILC